MTRFLVGLGAGCIGAGVMAAFEQPVLWVAVVGTALALIVWFGQFAVDFVCDLVDDLTT